jgi:hypothetical protein
MTATLGRRHAARAIRMLPGNGTRAGNRRGEGPAWTMLSESSCQSLGHRPEAGEFGARSTPSFGRRVPGHWREKRRLGANPPTGRRAYRSAWPRGFRSAGSRAGPVLPGCWLMGSNCMSSAIPDARRMRGVDRADRRQPCAVASRVR